MKMKVLLCCFFFQGVLLYSNAQSPFLVVLGTTQDGGSPHLGCSKKCCEMLFSSPDPSRKVVSLGIVDPIEKILDVRSNTQLYYTSQLVK